MRFVSVSQKKQRFGSLIEALHLDFSSKFQIAFVGSGGKTTLLYQLAREFSHLGKRVAVTTTTHMEFPSNFPFLEADWDLPACSSSPALGSILVYGHREGEKFSYPGDTLFEKATLCSDVLLVEADGSRRHPAKFPASHEPVIPPGTDLILAVTGMSAICQPWKAACHRSLLAQEAGLLTVEETITADGLMGLLHTAYLVPLRERYPDTRVVPVLNQADDDDLLEMGLRVLEDYGECDGIMACCL